MRITREDHPAIRTWGLKNGYPVAEFGPITDEVQQAFITAHDQAVKEASVRFMAEAGVWPVIAPMNTRVEAGAQALMEAFPGLLDDYTPDFFRKIVKTVLEAAG